MDLADRVKTLTPSKTLAITAKAKEMKQHRHFRQRTALKTDKI